MLQKRNPNTIEDLLHSVEVLKKRMQNAKSKKDADQIMKEYSALIDSYYCNNETITSEQIERLLAIYQ